MSDYLQLVGQVFLDVVKALVGVYVGYLLARRQDNRKLVREQKDAGNAAILAAGEAAMDAAMALWALLSGGKVGERDHSWLACRRALLTVESRIALALHEDIEGAVQVQLGELRKLVWKVIGAVDNLGMGSQEFTRDDRCTLNVAKLTLEVEGRVLFGGVSEDSKSETAVDRVRDEERPSGVPGAPGAFMRAYVYRRRHKRRGL